MLNTHPSDFMGPPFPAGHPARNGHWDDRFVQDVSGPYFQDRPEFDRGTDGSWSQKGSNHSAGRDRPVEIQFKGILLQPGSPTTGGKADWIRTRSQNLPLENAKLIEFIERSKAKRTTIRLMDLDPVQIDVINRLCDEETRFDNNPNAQWNVVNICPASESPSRGRGTSNNKNTKLRVILKRSDKRSGIYSLDQYDTNNGRDFIDLTKPPRLSPRERERRLSREGRRDRYDSLSEQDDDDRRPHLRRQRSRHDGFRDDSRPRHDMDPRARNISRPHSPMPQQRPPFHGPPHPDMPFRDGPMGPPPMGPPPMGPPSMGPPPMGLPPMGPPPMGLPSMGPHSGPLPNGGPFPPGMPPFAGPPPPFNGPGPNGPPPFGGPMPMQQPPPFMGPPPPMQQPQFDGPPPPPPHLQPPGFNGPPLPQQPQFHGPPPQGPFPDRPPTRTNFPQPNPFDPQRRGDDFPPPIRSMNEHGQPIHPPKLQKPMHPGNQSRPQSRNQERSEKVTTHLQHQLQDRMEDLFDAMHLGGDVSPVSSSSSGKLPRRNSTSSGGQWSPKRSHNILTPPSTPPTSDKAFSPYTSPRGKLSRTFSGKRYSPPKEIVIPRYTTSSRYYPTRVDSSRSRSRHHRHHHDENRSRNRHERGYTSSSSSSDSSSSRDARSRSHARQRRGGYSSDERSRSRHRKSHGDDHHRSSRGGHSYRPSVHYPDDHPDAAYRRRKERERYDGDDVERRYYGAGEYNRRGSIRGRDVSRNGRYRD